MYAKPCCGIIDPGRSTFKLGEITDRGLIDNAMSRAICPLCAPFLVMERRYEAQRLEYLCQDVPVLNFGLGLHTVLVFVLTSSRVGDPFVCDFPTAAIMANAQNLGSCSHVSVLRVIEHIGLKLPRSLEPKSGLGEPARKISQIVQPYFDLRLNSHRKK